MEKKETAVDETTGVEQTSLQCTQKGCSGTFTPARNQIGGYEANFVCTQCGTIPTHVKRTELLQNYFYLVLQMTVYDDDVMETEMVGARRQQAVAIFFATRNTKLEPEDKHKKTITAIAERLVRDLKALPEATYVGSTVGLAMRFVRFLDSNRKQERQAKLQALKDQHATKWTLCAACDQPPPEGKEHPFRYDCCDKFRCEACCDEELHACQKSDTYQAGDFISFMVLC
jgi:hypothetical protein